MLDSMLDSYIYLQNTAWVFRGNVVSHMVGSAQVPHSCVRDTDQLVELALFGIPDAAAQKNPVAN
jgi:hypothetical protein